ncbi:hypothetical protein ACTXG5_16515 [Mycobacterium sp. Dal123C01]|uniref:hypothetical protein n=1 Tax=Mycobacterium sp. Dal123C01 TaxID=3457577 RepID=UPI00403EEEC8
MTQTPSALDWLPAELAPVAMRLARADELQYDLADLCFAWSHHAFDFEQVRTDDGLLDLVVSAIRPIPPAIPMLVSEAVNHMRAAIDNVVFYLVEQARGSALPPEQARKVAMPIWQSAADLTNWANRTAKHVPELGTGTTLFTRIESLQPYRSLAVVTSLPIELATVMGLTDLHGVHPLLLLQGYSNEDKHRIIRPALWRAVVTRDDQPFMTQNLQWQEVQVGDVVSSGVREGNPVEVASRTAVCIQRPDGQVWVGPGSELSQIHGFVADVLIPKLVTGAPANPALPRYVDLSDNGETDEQRINAGRDESAHDRAGREAVAQLMADDTPPWVVRMPD